MVTMGHSRRTCGRCWAALLYVPLIALGCADVREPELEGERSDPPPKAVAHASAEPVAIRGTAASRLTPELLDILRMSRAMDDDAKGRYDAAIASIRGSASQGEALRAFYRMLPTEAYEPRTQTILLAGLIGTDSDVPILKDIATTPLSPAPVPAASDNEHEPTVFDEEAKLRIAAILSLSRIAQRGNAAAQQALIDLLVDGDDEMATLSAVELADAGKLGSQERRLLEARGLRGSLARLNFEATMKLDAPVLGKRPNKSVVVPPSAEQSK
jgi:hypothetical protein